MQAHNQLEEIYKGMGQSSEAKEKSRKTEEETKMKTAKRYKKEKARKFRVERRRGETSLR